MNNEKLYKIHLGSVLLTLSPETRADDDKRTDEQVIQELAKRYDEVRIQELIEVGGEVLATIPFPWEWLTDLVGSYWDKDTQTLIEDPKFYHKWLARLVELLEEEAKRQGKL